MTQSSVKKNKKNEKSSLKKVVLIALFMMLFLLVAWHLLFPLLGISIVISESLLGIAIASIVLMCIATLLFFIFTGIGIIILWVGMFIWTLLAIALFPLLFPVLVPILLLMFVVGWAVRK